MIEFRIPISPTRGFYTQVRFYEAALRRLGGPYAEALVTVVVGDNCDIVAVRRENRWSEGRRVRWLAVPRDVFDRYGMHGTANWRYLPESSADVVVMSDADSVIVGDIVDAIGRVAGDRPAIAGHMAHFPPPATGSVPPSSSPAFWPTLFELFDAPFPRDLHAYSMDAKNELPRSPPYYNLGFVVLNRSALQIFSEPIFDFEDAFKAVVESPMRCQIACTRAMVDGPI